MLFEITLLREKGKRSKDPQTVYTDAHIRSVNQAGYMCLQASSYSGGMNFKANPLFEARIVKMTPEEIVLLGFEQVDDQSYVQEWKLNAASRLRTDWLTYAEASQARVTEKA